MTTVLVRPEQAAQWSAMPGWNIVGDLTPPELINMRRLAVLRKWLVVLLASVVLLCGAGYGFATYRHSEAADGAAAASRQTTQLQQELSRYSGITRIQTLTSGADAQVAQLLSQDVDVATLAARIRAALPSSMSIQSLSVTFTATPASTSTVPGATTPSLGLSGLPTIGTIAITGSSRSITDLPAFVEQLSAITGLENVLPQSDVASSSKGAGQYSVQATMTNTLLSHHFASGPTGGK